MTSAHQLLLPSNAIAILAWVGIQLAALALGAWAQPVWAHHPEPRTSLAVHQMLAVQLAGSSVLFPILLQNWRAGASVAALSWAFLQLAGLLDATPQRDLIEVAVFVSLWIAGLSACSQQLRTLGAKLSGVAIAAGWVIGGVVLFYLQMEAADPGSSAPNPANFSPLLAVLKRLGSEQPFSQFSWFEALVPLLVASVLRLGRPSYRSTASVA